MLKQVGGRLLVPSSRLVTTRHTLACTQHSFSRRFHQTPRRPRDTSQIWQDLENKVAQREQKPGGSSQNGSSAVTETTARITAQDNTTKSTTDITENPGQSSMDDITIDGPALWDALETGLMTPPHEFFILVHDAVPLWAVSVPIATISIRVMVTALTNYLTRDHRARLQSIHAFSIANAFAKKYAQARDAHESAVVTDQSGKIVVKAPPSIQLQGWINTIKMRYRASPWGITRWNLINIPVWLATIEALRSMVGTRYGLFGLVCRSLGLSANEGDVLFPAWIEPTMSVQGALWFPDLTLADPTGALSYTLGFAMAISIFRSTAAVRKQSYMKSKSRLHRLFIRAAPGIGLALIPMTMQFPAALLLYWITSSISASIVVSALSRFRRGSDLISVKARPLQTGLDSLSPPTWMFDKQSIKARPRHHRRQAVGSLPGKGTRQ